LRQVLGPWTLMLKRKLCAFGCTSSAPSARLIDLAEGNRQKRDVEGADPVRHAAEEHAAWLEVLGIDDDALISAQKKGRADCDCCLMKRRRCRWRRYRLWRYRRAPPFPAGQQTARGAGECEFYPLQQKKFRETFSKATECQ
jgi:hypothetical protein